MSVGYTVMATYNVNLYAIDNEPCLDENMYGENVRNSRAQNIALYTLDPR